MVLAFVSDSKIGDTLGIEVSLLLVENFELYGSVAFLREFADASGVPITISATLGSTGIKVRPRGEVGNLVFI